MAKPTASYEVLQHSQSARRSQLKTTSKILIVTLVVGIAGFLTESNGPLGTFWPPDSSMPPPVGAQLPLFMLLGVVEALALGLGASFLLFGYPMMKANTSVSGPMTRAAHLSITWVLMNWWAHDSLHIHNGMYLNGLLRIEYGFHVTLIFSGLILARFFLAVVQAPARSSV